ncbi:hypothetical protein KVH30_02220 [Streptomyces olivaceus]|uniref:hypothetical protein n=1 Tax=Streptomyces olivaceus TaxID=47716 RepID=UPI001CCB9D5D|nr:hypothetical protein [Streptomyces olivaceus]MBZ6290388.1 hypothetical protein [Streptomyces olivaceus]MBZ6324340.1 hypothetical protein [Streptomyces olivaceus]
MGFTRTEPDRSSQTCGYQTQVDHRQNDGHRFCIRPKARGKYFCTEHHQNVLDTYGEIRMAPGNAIGK